MAVAHQLGTRFPSTNTSGFDTTTGDRTFSHAPGATPPNGVIVLVACNATTQPCSGVLYGGVAMTWITSAVDTSEAGRIDIWFLGSGIPTGTQTVTLQSCTADSKFASCNTVTASGDTQVSDYGTVSTTTSTNPSVAINDPLSSCWVYGAVAGGAASPTSYAPGSGYSATFNGDYGQRSAQMSRGSTIFLAGSFVYNFTYATSDDWCIAAVAIGEAPAGNLVTGDAALTGAGSLSASGLKQRTGAAALTGAGSSTTAGSHTGIGAAALSGGGSSTAVAEHTGIGDASLTGAGSLSATGGRLVLGVAALSGTGSQSATGARIVPGSASLAGTGSSTTAGTRQRSGAAALSGTGSSTSTGQHTGIGAAALVGSGSTTVAGTRIRFTSASLTGAGTSTGTGTRIRLGSASLTGAGSLSADGNVVGGSALVTGSADLAGSGSLSATGTRVTSGVAPLSGGPLTDLFSGSSLDSKWSITEQDAGVGIAVGSGVLSISIPIGAGGYGTVRTLDTRDFTGATVTTAIASKGTVESGYDLGLSLIKDASNAIQIEMYGATPTLSAYKTVAGVTTEIGSGVNASAVTHLRMRELAGTVYYEYSTDGGASYTTHATELVSNLFAITALQGQIFVGDYNGTADGTTVTFDEFIWDRAIATGTRQRTDTAALTGAGSLTATGVVIPPLGGAADLAGSGSMTASGTVIRNGAAALSGAGSMTAAGWKFGGAFSNLRDRFTGSLDTTLWEESDPGGLLSVNASDQLQIDMPQVSGTGAYTRTLATYDITGDSVQLKVLSVAPFGFAGQESSVQLLDPVANNSVYWHKSSHFDALRVWESIDGVDTQLFSVPWNAAAMRYWRIRESGGTLYFDYSADAVSWTNLGSRATTGLDPTNLQYLIESDTYTADNAASSFIVDDVNVRVSAGAAALAGTGSQTIAGLRTRYAVAGLTGAGSLAADGTVIPPRTVVTGRAALLGSGMSVETFDGTSLGSARWTTIAPAGTSIVVNGTCELHVNSGTSYAQLVVVEDYNLDRGDVFQVHFSSIDTSESGFERGIQISLDGSNYIYFQYQTGSPTTLKCQIVTSGVGGASGAIASTDPYLRIRKVGSTILCDSSADGVSWTNRLSTPATFGCTALEGAIYAGDFNGPSVAKTVVIDDVFVPGSLSARGTRIATAVASLAGTGATSASARLRANGSSTLSGLGVLAATATQVSKGSASLAGLGSLFARGSNVWTGSASLSGAGTATAAGSIALRAATTTSLTLSPEGSNTLSLSAEPTDSLSLSSEATGSLSLAPEPTDALTLNPE